MRTHPAYKCVYNVPLRIMTGVRSVCISARGMPCSIPKPGDRSYSHPDAFVHCERVYVCPSARSHLALEEDDPALGEKFSTATLQQGAGHGAVPSRVHGAPSTAAESREVLARLKRMAGFESQDFDPSVSFTTLKVSEWCYKNRVHHSCRTLHWRKCGRGT